jgi:hypothetical protein
VEMTAREEQFMREYPLRRAAMLNLTAWSALVALFVLLLAHYFLVDLSRGLSPFWVILLGVLIFTIWFFLIGQIYLPPAGNYTALWNTGVEFHIREQVVFVPYRSVLYLGPKPDPERLKELLHQHHAMAPLRPAVTPPGHRLVPWFLIYRGERYGHSVLFFPTSTLVDRLQELVAEAGGQTGR